VFHPSWLTQIFKNPAPARLTPADIQSVAQIHGLTPAHISAIAEVEGAGYGYLPTCQPKILFEAHLFSRLTGHKFDATHPAISSLTWNRNLYGGGAKEYGRLQEAMALDETAALATASWGLFQVLGSNHKSAGSWGRTAHRCGLGDRRWRERAGCSSDAY
jgi:hypothetical protein